MSDSYWKPALYKGSTETLLLLPKPVIQCSVRGGWKFDIHEVPLQRGAYTYDHSKIGRSITLTGQIAWVGDQGSEDREDFDTEESMWDRYEALDTFLDMTDEDDSFELFLYHDSTSETYKKLISCVPVGLDIDFGDETRNPFRYSLKMFARNPQYYAVAEGLTA